METTLKHPSKLAVHIRWFIRRDLPEVIAIEEDSFEHPWTEEDFIRVLRRKDCIARVAEYDERIIGFFIYELHAARYHLINFAVHADFRRKGVGAAMIGDLTNKLSPARRNRLSMNVRERNVAGQIFLRSLGFKAVSIIRDLYEETDEDAYCMEVGI